MKGILMVAMLSCVLMACATTNSEQVSAEQASVEKSIIQSNAGSSPSLAIEESNNVRSDELSLNEAPQLNQETAVSHEVTESAPAPLPEMIATSAPANIATVLPEKKALFSEQSTYNHHSEVARYHKNKSKKSVQKTAKKSASAKRMIASKSAKKSKVAKKMSKAQCKKIAKNIKKAKKSEVAMCKIAKKRYAKL